MDMEKRINLCVLRDSVVKNIFIFWFLTIKSPKEEK